MDGEQLKLAVSWCLQGVQMICARSGCECGMWCALWVGTGVPRPVHVRVGLCVCSLWVYLPLSLVRERVHVTPRAFAVLCFCGYLVIGSSHCALVGAISE